MNTSLPWGFPGSPVVGTFPFNAGGVGLMPGGGPKIPCASCPKNQNIRQKRCCNKFKKDFKDGSHKKEKIKTKRMKASLFEAQMSFTSLGNAFHRRSPVL